MKRGWTVSFIILLLLVGLIGCKSSDVSKSANQQPEQKQTAENDPEQKAPEPKKEEEPKPPEHIYPLTGLPAEHEVTNRPVGVMINNFSLARPQSGVYQADLVYEALAEGAITRFLAIFQSHQPKVIGPVRSARPYYIRLSNGYDAFYVHFGWSPQARALIESSGKDNLNGIYYDGTLFYRADFRKAPHNAYISYKNILKGAEKKGYNMKADIKPLPFLTEEEVNALSGEKAKAVKINYLDRYSVRYVYQPDTGKYIRYSDGEQSKDLETKTPVTLSNVMVVSAPHRFIDSYPRREINLKDGGEAWLFQQGVVQKVKWKNVDGRIYPVKDGKILGFVPGRTWINIVPTDPGLSGSVTISGGDQDAN
ncbi:MAG TPA: DUF3048 domain-containing protein [Bacillales bacterium]|nr:DUF3048 domain-containing protein [Bacillales bacterium]